MSKSDFEACALGFFGSGVGVFFLIARFILLSQYFLKLFLIVSLKSGSWLSRFLFLVKRVDRKNKEVLVEKVKMCTQKR